MTAHPSKTDLRTACLARRQAISAADHARMSQACSALLCDVVHTQAAQKPLIVAGYAPIKQEIDIMGALAALAQQHHVMVLPVVEQDRLDFHPWNPSDALTPGAFGVGEPSSRLPAAPDMLFVPLLAFDRRGHRLGYGRGYYDRALRNLRERNPFLRAIGVGFSLQEEPQLPSEPHDEPLDTIVTEKEIIEIA